MKVGYNWRMGKRGPQPKPTHLRLLECNPSGRALPNREPEVPKALKVPAPWKFQGDRLTIWNEVCEQLAAMKGLSPVDTKMLALYVDTLFRLDRVAEQLDEFATNTMSIKGPTGLAQNAKTIPQFNQWITLSTQALRLAQNFGMTPSARARIVFFGSATGDPKDDPFD